MNPDRRDPKKFGRLLKTAVRKIALLDDKNISLVQTELGFALGRDSGNTAIQFWERGNIPAEPADVDMLKDQLAARGGLTAQESVAFVGYAGFSELVPTVQAAFIAGPPISRPRHFFGREYELTRLFSLWRHTAVPMQNAAIVGLRGSGKTSLLLHLPAIADVSPGQLRPGQRAGWLADAADIHWVFADFRQPQLGTRQGLLRHLLTALDLPAPSPCTLDRFVDIVSRGLPGRTVILLDEMDVALERYDELDDAFWDGLRALASTLVDGRLAFVLATRDLPQQLARRTNRSSDFFSIFAYLARLGPLTDAEARQLVASSPRPFPPDDVEWILEQSGRWPLLLQILCRERLVALQEGTEDGRWRDEALRQIEPFRHLLQTD